MNETAAMYKAIYNYLITIVYCKVIVKNAFHRELDS